MKRGQLMANQQQPAGVTWLEGRTLRCRGAWTMPDVAPVEYMDFLLNNREVQAPTFEASAAKCEGVFETLNMITRMLLHKFLSDGVRK